MSVGTTLAILNVRTRDVLQITGVALQFLFFLSPVLYPTDLAPAEWHGIPVRTILALKDPRWGDIGARTKVIAEFSDERHATTIGGLAADLVIPIVPQTTIARIAAHVCRSRGVSDVYQDLLDFSGHEIYDYEL